MKANARPCHVSPCILVCVSVVTDIIFTWPWSDYQTCEISHNPVTSSNTPSTFTFSNFFLLLQSELHIWLLGIVYLCFPLSCHHFLCYWVIEDVGQLYRMSHNLDLYITLPQVSFYFSHISILRVSSKKSSLDSGSPVFPKILHRGFCIAYVASHQKLYILWCWLLVTSWVQVVITRFHVIKDLQCGYYPELSGLPQASHLQACSGLSGSLQLCGQ